MRLWDQDGIFCALDLEFLGVDGDSSFSKLQFTDNGISPKTMTHEEKKNNQVFVLN
jgi:hypothetical protein